MMIHGYEKTKPASERVGLSDSQIRRLLETGKVNGMKDGKDWLVDARSLDHYMSRYAGRGNRRRKGRRPAGSS